MSSTRTQIYLTVDQRKRLDQLTRAEGRSLASLIREALDQYLSEHVVDPDTALTATFGRARDLKAPSRDEWQRG